MSFPITVTFRGVEHSEAIDAYIRKRAGKLDRYDDVQICRIAVEAPHKRHVHGNRYHIRISVAVPGDAVFVGRPTALDPRTEDLYATIDAAFDDANRNLIEHGRRLRAARRDYRQQKSA